MFPKRRLYKVTKFSKVKPAANILLKSNVGTNIEINDPTYILD